MAALRPLVANYARNTLKPPEQTKTTESESLVGVHIRSERERTSGLCWRCACAVRKRIWTTPQQRQYRSDVPPFLLRTTTYLLRDQTNHKVLVIKQNTKERPSLSIQFAGWLGMSVSRRALFLP
jgi:hypothetical protein